MTKFATAALVLGLSVSPALAKPADRGPTPGLGYAHGVGKHRGTPGPIAGAGLPILAIAGAIGGWRLLARRRAEREAREAGTPNG